MKSNESKTKQKKGQIEIKKKKCHMGFGHSGNRWTMITVLTIDEQKNK